MTHTKRKATAIRRAQVQSTQPLIHPRPEGTTSSRNKYVVQVKIRHEHVWDVVEVQSRALVTKALDGGKWSALRPGRFADR
jgi:hypothetical protein